MSVFGSALTARNVTTSADSWSSCLTSSSSNRACSTPVLVRPSCRTASRRNATFLVFDSTISIDIPGATNFIGMAGDPPPEPMSTDSIL